MPRRPRPRVRMLVTGLTAACLVLGGCGGDGDDPAAVDTSAAATEPAPASAPAATSEPTEASESAATSGPTTVPSEAGAATVMVAESSLGDIVVDADGNTLYVFDADPEGGSACTGDCLANWPPLVAEGPTAGDGVGAGLGTFVREDTGDSQVTIGGRALYYWANDVAPGDVTGHGVGDVWWAVASDGTAVAADAAAAAEVGADVPEGVDADGY